MKQTVALSRLYGHRSKVDETVLDVREGRRSFSTGSPVVVSRLDHPRGGLYVLDGYHRVVEALMRRDRVIVVTLDPHVPRIERTGGAFILWVRNKVNLAAHVRAAAVPKSLARRDVDLSRYAWEASRHGQRGQSALEVLQDLLMERYGPELAAAQRYAAKKAKTRKTRYVVAFVPQRTRWLAIQSTFGRLPRLDRGTKVTVTEGSGIDSGRRGTIQRVRAGVVDLIDERGQPFNMFASRLREGWGPTSLRFEGSKQKELAPFTVIPTGRMKHMHQIGRAHV